MKFIKKYPVVFSSIIFNILISIFFSCRIESFPAFGVVFNLIFNFFIIILFGLILEENIGSKNTLILFLISIFSYFITLKFLKSEKYNILVVATSLAYTFLTGGVVTLKRNWRSYTLRILIFYGFISFLSVVMLLTTNGFDVTILGLVGVFSYFIFDLIFLNREQ